jgi:L-asparaginase II
VGHRGYLDPGHPCNGRCATTVEDLTGVPVAHTAVDGCGAPLFSSTPAGLARAFRAHRDRVARHRGGPGRRRVARASVVGGGHRARRRPAGCRRAGLVAKDGAEGVFAAALPDGRAVALKILDGSRRPVRAVVAAALQALGVDGPELAEAGHTAVLGHGGSGGVDRTRLGRPAAG